MRELLSAPGLAPVRTIPTSTSRLSLWRNSSFPRKSAIKSSWQQPKRWFFDQCYLGGQRNAINSTFHRSRGEISILFKTTWVEAGPGRLDLCLWLFYVAKLSFNTSRGTDGGRLEGGITHIRDCQTSSKHSHVGWGWRLAMLFSLDLLSFSYFSVYAFQRTKSLVNICCIEFANNELYKSETCTMVKSAMNAKYLLFNISDRLHAILPAK